MKKLILTGALGAAVLLLSACGDTDADKAGESTAKADDFAADAEADGEAPTASPDAPGGTRTVEAGGVAQRADAGTPRAAAEAALAPAAAEDGTRQRVNSAGRQVRVDDDRLAVDLPGLDGLDVDVGKNNRGRVDVDVSTDGSDASDDRENDR